MKKHNIIILSVLSTLLLLAPSLVSAHSSEDTMIDRVSLELSAQRWVKTSTAKLEVGINATLTKLSLVQMRKDILKNLSIIAKTDWHITAFNRIKNSSGLETFFVSASARVDESVLPFVNVKAKKMSQPGIQYKISSIDFSPSSSDVKKIEKLVRHDLYKKINEEISTLNNEYQNQNYSLYSVSIINADENTPFSKHAKRLGTQSFALQSSNMSASNLTVSNKLILNARVVLASNRKTEKAEKKNNDIS